MGVGVGGWFCSAGVGVVSSTELRSGGSDSGFGVLKGIVAVVFCLVIFGATPVSVPRCSCLGNLLLAIWGCVLSVDLALLGCGMFSSVSVSILCTE